MSADRNLLFGVLALQLDFITRDQLIAGMQAWVNDKSKPLAEILQAGGALSALQRQALEPLVAMHIQQHGNDPQQSLATLSSADRLRRELNEIEDAEVQQSLVSLGQARTKEAADPEATLDPTLSLGTQTSAGTRFRILRPHARGGLGEVFVARDNELGREVALKEIQHGHSHDPDARARFTREAEITGGLEHPGIVPVYGLGAYPDGRPFYAMRFIRGKSLQDAIKAYHAKEKTNPTEQNLELRRLLQRFIDVCEAIDYAHSRGVLHRDLKPGNIMLGRYGETLVVDWGLAKAVGQASSQSVPSPDPAQLPEPALVPSSNDSSEATQLGSALGTIAYMSPEQANGRWDLLSPASDVFSLGATLYHLLTGQPPYAGNIDQAYARAREGGYVRPRAIAPNIPIPLEAICLKALAVRPQDRYSTANDFAQDIERYLADEPIAAMPESVLSRANRWTRRHRHWMQAGSVALLFVAISALGAYFYQRETSLQNQTLAVQKEQLARDKTKLADEAIAKAEALRSSVARNYFAHGVSEYAAGRIENGVLDLQRALAMLSDIDPLRPHYEQVLLDRAMRGGPSPIPFPNEGNFIAFSPDGDRVLTASDDKTAQLWDARTGAALGEPMRHEAVITDLEFSARGDHVLTVSDRTVQLWNARTGAALGKPMRHEDVVSAVAISLQGDRVLTGSNDNTAQLWDSRTGVALGEPMRHEGVVSAVALSPQGDRAVTGSRDKTARLWDARTGGPLGEPLRHEASVVAVGFSPQGDRVLTGSMDETARFWDARTGAPLGDSLQHAAPVWVLAFSPEGDRILTGSDDKTARLWDARTGAALGETMRHDAAVIDAAFLALGDHVLTLNLDGTTRLWDARTGEPLGEPIPDRGLKSSGKLPGDAGLTGSTIWDARAGGQLGAPLLHGTEVTVVAFSPKGDRILMGSNSTTKLRDGRTGALLGNPLNHGAFIAAVAFSPQCDHVLTWNFLDKCARLWDAGNGAPLGQPMRHGGEVLAMAFSPQGDRVVTGSSDKTARLWDARTGAPVRAPLLHECSVSTVAFSPLGDRVLTGGADTARLWDARTCAPLGQPLRHERNLNAVAFSPQGDRVVTGSSDKTAQVWDARTGTALGEPLRHENEVHVVAFSPNGDCILTGSAGTAQLWHSPTGALLGEPMRHKYRINTEFSPDGGRVVTTSLDTVQLWDARTGAALGEPLRHKGIVNDVAFSLQGDLVLTGSNDKTAQLWDVSIMRPKDIAAYAALVTGAEVDSEGNVQTLTKTERRARWERFCVDEAEWIAALARRVKRIRAQYLHDRLIEGMKKKHIFIAWQCIRWLPTVDLPKMDGESHATPAMNVLVAWYRDGKLDEVAGALAESAEVPEAEAGKVLAALEEAIPVLYWETDERLGALRKGLRNRAMQQSPPAR